jgi:hypothetical protein
MNCWGGGRELIKRHTKKRPVRRETSHVLVSNVYADPAVIGTYHLCFVNPPPFPSSVACPFEGLDFTTKLSVPVINCDAWRMVGNSRRGANAGGLKSKKQEVVSGDILLITLPSGY